ncbi:MAG: hypothetical protein KY432_08515 [Acidobacteria bacterium]|nr:hypothetical protein [Acidobacteriota bacterium]
MGKKSSLLIAIATIALLMAFPATAEHAWSDYHWERAGNPITINHGDNVDPVKWGDRLIEALTDWNSSSVLDTPKVSGNTSPKACRPTSGMVEVCSADYGNTGWLGVAQIWVSGSHITQGTAKVNDYYHDREPYNSYSWKQLVLCQEVGHTYGLGHQNEDFNTDVTTSCMEYTSEPAGNESPDNHDYDMLETIYAHLDGDGGGGDGGGGGDCWPPGKCKNGAAPPAFSMPLPTAETWGEHVRTSPNGGQSLFVQDFGGGYKVFTHVTWTLEVAAELAGHDH